MTDAQRIVAPPTTRVALPLAIAAGGLVTSIALGVRATFGIFLDPVIDTIGTDRGTFAFAIAVQQIIWGLSQPVAGAIADRYGTARVLTAGAFFFALAMVTMSVAGNGAMLVLSAGFLSGLAVATASFTVVLSAVGRMAPPEKRSMALGLVSAAGSIGQFVLIPVARTLIERASWQTASVTLGGIALLVLVAAPVLRGRSIDQMVEEDRQNAEAAIRPLRNDLARAGRSVDYLLLNAAFFVCGFHVTFIATHLPSYVGDLGITLRAGDTALMMIGLFNVFGSLAAGYFGGRHSKTKLLAGIYGLRAVAIGGFVLLPASAITTVVFGAAMGALWLSTVPLTSGIVTQQFGTANAGTLFGIVFLSHQLGAFGGAWLGGLLRDSTGSYDSTWWIAIGLGVFAMVMHLLIDDGPVPDDPAPVKGGLATAGGLASLALLLGSLGVITAPTRAEAAAVEEARVSTHICVIGTSV